jgi:hypothetical protein
VPELDYTPRAQFLDFHQRSERWAAMVCHRRAGKTVAAVNELLIRALYTQKENGRYAYIAPYYRQAKDTAWTYLKQAAQPFVASLKEIRESELRVRLINGSWITLYGADNPDALRGIYLDGVVLDEFGDARPSLWGEVVLPTLADRQGWALFIGTPKGKNHFYQVCEKAKHTDGWFYKELKASTSGILPEKELAALREIMSEEQYEQEMNCSFTAAVTGTYYASIIEQLELREQISSKRLYDPEQPVHVACDLGFTDSTALWFWQYRPDGLAFVNYYEEHSKPLQHYLDYLDDTRYRFDTIWLPHDARAKTLQTGKSTIEQVLEHFTDSEVSIRIAPQMKLQHGIDAARLVLNKCYFDQTACGDGIEALRAYRRRYDEVSKSFSDKPVHDFSSHGADAFRYAALVTRDSLNLPKEPITDENMTPEGYFKPKGFTLDELFASNEQKSKLSIVRMRL